MYNMSSKSTVETHSIDRRSAAWARARTQSTFSETELIKWLFSVSPAAWYGLAAAVPAVAAEYLYRALPGTDGSFYGWIRYAYLWVPLQLSIGFFIYKLVSVPGQSLLDAFVVWAFSTTAMRVFITVAVLGDTVKGGTWFALALLTMAKVAQTFWGR